MTAAPALSMEDVELETLTRLNRQHPVLKMMSPVESIHDNRNLRQFVLQHVVLDKKDSNPPPLTLTSFCSQFLDFRLKPIYRLISSDEVKLILQLGQTNILDVLGELAFNEYLHYKHITDTSLAAAFKPLLKMHDVCGCKGTLETLRLGLLVLDETTKIGCYKFTERWLQYFLIARYQVKLLFDRVSKGQRLKLSGDLEESINKLSRTVDIWAMTFGLMSEDWNLCSIQTKLMKLIRVQLMAREDMPSVYLSAFFCQCVYESWNHGHLITLLDDFTHNQMINFRNLNLPHHRIPYMLRVIGTVIPIAHGLYGMVLSKFGMTGEVVGLLTDPSNETSEIHLSLVDLSHNTLGAGGMSRLQRFMVKASSISYLNLSCTSLGVQGTVILAKWLMCMPLVSLSISGNAMTDNGLAEILKNLRYCYSLESLDISDNLLTHYSSFILCEHIVFATPELRRLNISRNYLNQLQVENIKTTVQRLEGGQKRRAVDLDISDQHEEEPPAVEPSSTLMNLLPVNFLDSPPPARFSEERQRKSVLRRSLVCGGTAERMKVIYDLQRQRRPASAASPTPSYQCGDSPAIHPRLAPLRGDLFH